MKNLLIAAALLFSTAAQAAGPEWKEKPVQCADTHKIFDAYIVPNKMKPMFIGVANIMTHEMQEMVAPVAFYLGENGTWLMIELGEDYSCVITLGDGFDTDFNPETLNNIILGGKTT